MAKAKTAQTTAIAAKPVQPAQIIRVNMPRPVQEAVVPAAAVSGAVAGLRAKARRGVALGKAAVAKLGPQLALGVLFGLVVAWAIGRFMPERARVARFAIGGLLVAAGIKWRQVGALGAGAALAGYEAVSWASEQFGEKKALPAPAPQASAGELPEHGYPEEIPGEVVDATPVNRGFVA